MLILALGVVLLGATGWTAARRWCGSSGFAELVVAAWLLAFAEIVVLTLALGLVDALSRWAMLAALGIVLAAVAVGGRRAPRPVPRLRAVVTTAREALRDPLVAAMGVVALLGLGYATALGVGTPPNDWDSLIYHLPRAALWNQQGRVGYVSGTSDERIDVAAPHAEIGLLFTMVLSHGDRWVTMVQLTSLLALGGTVFALARRMGLDVRAALYGSFAFLCLPVLLLQAGTALNDVVVAAFLAASVLFALVPGRAPLGVSALALALAAGTKPTTFLALPAAIVVVCSLRPRKDWLGVGLAWLAGLATGSYWYFLNLARTGRLDGGLAEIFDQVPDRQPLAVLLRVYQLSVNLLEMPATAGRGRWAYAVAAACLLLAGIVVLARGRRLPGLGLAAFGALVALVPWALHRGPAWFERPARRALDAVGSHDLADGVSGPLLLGYPTPFYSTFGAVAIVLTAASLPLLAAAVRTRRMPRGSLSLPAAPLLTIVALATAVTFDELRARFLIFPIALAAVAWGLVRQWRTLAYGVVVLAAATTFATLAFASWKPSGVGLLLGIGAAGTDSGSVWTEPRWRLQGSGRLVDMEANRFVAEHVPPRAATGLVMGRDHSLYAFFNGIDRAIRLVPVGEDAPADVEWLVVSADRRDEVPALVERGWRRALVTPSGWAVLRRATAR